MLFDTDVLIWVLRGSEAAARAAERAARRSASVVTYMELVQAARGKRKMTDIRGFLVDFGFDLLPLTESIGHRAAVYMEEYALRPGMRMADALIAATAVERGLVLCSADQKHYRAVGDLRTKVFRP